MEALATIVFERTPKGAVAMKSNGDEMPRRLRTLLLAVDGRSPVTQYVPFLTAFAPLSEKFAELEQMGYLRRKGELPIQPEQQPSYESGLNDMAQSLSSQAVPPAATTLDTFALELQVLARQMGNAGWQQEASSETALPAARRYEDHARPPVALTASVGATPLQDILREMESFLSRAAGLDGLPVALMLSQITSLAQLRQELPSYLQLIQPYGADAAEHGLQLVKLIDHAGG